MSDDIEKKRVEEVIRYLQIDFSKSSEFQDIVDLAALLCDKPVALITLLDESLNWLKVRSGIDIDVMPRDTSFCQFSIQQNDVLIVPDATKDPRFKDNPLVQSEPRLRFYAGAPLTFPNGLKLGTLCLFDSKPNDLSELQRKTFGVLARQVVFLMELEMSRQSLQWQIEETEAKNVLLRKISQLQSHQIRQPLTTIMGLVNLINEGHQTVNAEWLEMFRSATEEFDANIHTIVTESIGSKDLRAIRFQKMVEEIEDYAILLLDREGKIENWNKGAEKLKGYFPGEVIGKNFRIFYTPEDIANDRPRLLIGQAVEKGFAKDEGWRVKKDGSRFWGSILITAIHNDNGEVIGFTKVTRDLTEKKTAEEQQKKYVLQLRKAYKERVPLAFITSYDLQEPLKTIDNFLQLFSDRFSDVIDAEGKSYIDAMTKSVERMKQQIARGTGDSCSE